MKTIFNKQKRSVAGVLIALTALTTALTGCQEDFELDLPLAVSARELSLTKDAGSTHVLVYSNGDWTARFTRPVKWASLNKLQGYGNNEIVFTYSANYGISRKIGVVFEKGSLTDTVMFSQAGAITDASLSFSKPAVTLLKSRSQIFTPISTNLRYCIDDLEASVTYYDNDGLPNDPVTVLTRAEEGEEGGEGEGGDEPQAQPVEPWISNVSATYKGITFEVTDNDSGFARIADLTLFIEDAKGEITKSVLTVTQGIALPALKLDSNAETYEGYAQDCAVPATTNNLVPYSDQIGYDVAYDVPVAEGAEWILKPAITDDGLTFSLAKNEGSEPRTATIRLNFTDEHGNSVSASCKITQKPYPTAADFAAVRALTPGEITLQQYIEGYIVSDPDSKNVVSSPQTQQFFFDRGENDRTAYIESLDGKWGFCLKFASSEDNTGPLLEGAPLPERGHARKEELPRVLHHHGTYRGQHPRNLDARRVQDSGQDEDDRRTHRRRHLHAGVGHQPRNHVQGRRLHQLHRRLFVQGQHQPDRHGYRPALGRGPADVLRQHGPDHLHADQYGRSLAAFQLGPRPGFQLRRTAGFGHVPRHRRG